MLVDQGLTDQITSDLSTFRGIEKVVYYIITADIIGIFIILRMQRIEQHFIFLFFL